jgi:hypothetical protein
MSNSFQIGDIVKHTNSIEVYGFISNITLFRDKTLYSVFWFEFPQYGEGGDYEAHHLTKVA